MRTTEGMRGEQDGVEARVEERSEVARGDPGDSGASVRWCEPRTVDLACGLPLDSEHGGQQRGQAHAALRGRPGLSVPERA